MKIFLTGHGGHTVEDGYFDLPKNTTVTFYTGYAKLMLSTDVYKLVDGSHKGDPDRVIKPYMKCPDMTLYPDDDIYLKPTKSALSRNPGKRDCRVVNVNMMKVNGAMPASVRLSQIIAALPGNDFVWTCCADLSLNHVAGVTTTRDAGLNAGQRLDGKFINFDKDTSAWSGGYY